MRKKGIATDLSHCYFAVYYVSQLPFRTGYHLCMSAADVLYRFQYILREPAPGVRTEQAEWFR